MRRLSRRSLPLDDPAVEALSPHERQAVAEMWTRRSEAELRVAATFSGIVGDLFASGADPEVLAIASRAVGDEVRHAEICRRVAGRYSDGSVAWPAPCHVALPEYPDVPPATRCALHMLGMCCLNETIASAFLRACLDGAETLLSKAALTELLTDEIDHARLGWAYLASKSVTDEVRDELRRRFGSFRDAAIQVWTTQNRSPLAQGVPSHGLLPNEAVEATVVEAIARLVVPGLSAVGIRVS
jgi:hypothetical protein